MFFERLTGNCHVKGRWFSLMVIALLIMAVVPAVRAQNWGWPQQDKLIASDAAADDYFGVTVSVSGDYALVGSYLDDDNGSNSGCAYIFKKSDTPGDPNWYEQDKLTASDGTVDDLFGYSVSVSGDYAIVGAYGDGGVSGSAYIFKKSDIPSDPNWYEQDKITASDGAAVDFFGRSVSVSGDYAIVGAYGDEGYTGSAYIFKKSDTPGDLNWYEQDKLTASDAVASDYFGGTVSVNGDYAIVGAYGDGGESGSAYIFRKSDTPGDSNWYEQDKLTASDGAIGDWFGVAVSVSGDYAIVGASRDDDNGSNSGSAYIFKKSDTPGDSNWYEQDKLTASDTEDGDYFGYSVSVSGDYAIAGAFYEGANGNNSGSAYIFRKSDTPGDPNWYEQDKLIASDAAADDYFGVAVSVSGDYALVGACFEDANGSNSGSAYIFKLTCPPVDLNGDCYVDFEDFAIFAEYWLQGI